MSEGKTVKSIREWYEGRSVFVTGGTGFMGKILLEKLVRALPGLTKVYVLIRTKRGIPPAERLKKITMLPIFDKIRESEPRVLKKLVAVEGDVTLDNLGLSQSSFQKLQHVSVVFHSAATLRLEAELRDAIDCNTIGTRRVLEMCKKLPKLEAVVHMSTAFCHADIELLEEKIYPPPHDPEDIIHMLNVLDDKTLQSVTPQILGLHPNSYTYSKRLAETVASSYGPDLPIVILRPSIVIPAIQEPLPGWVDSLNGPVGIMVGAGKGAIRSMLVEPGNHAEIVPVDIAINGMIAVAWHRATHSISEVPAYNMTQSEMIRITWAEILERGKGIARKHPFSGPVIWYPDGDMHQNKLIHKLICFFCHFLPAYFIDFLMLIFMQPRFMVRIYKRISVGLDLLQYFTTREWKYSNKTFLKIVQDISPEDYEIFYMANVKYDIDLYLMSSILGTRKYCLKDDLSTIPRARRLHMCLYILDRFCRVSFCAGFMYLLMKLFGIKVFPSNDLFSYGFEHPSLQGVAFK